MLHASQRSYSPYGKLQVGKGGLPPLSFQTLNEVVIHRYESRSGVDWDHLSIELEQDRGRPTRGQDRNWYRLNRTNLRKGFLFRSKARAFYQRHRETLQ